MSFRPEFYRPSFYDILTDTVIPKKKNKEVDKTQDVLFNIRNSSKFLKNLQFVDTESLYTFLKNQDVDVSSLINASNSESKKNDTDASKIENGEPIETDLIANPNQAPQKFFTLSDLKSSEESLILEIEGILGEVTDFAGLIENLLDFIIDLISEKVPTCSTIDDETVHINKAYRWSYMGVKNSSDYKQNVFVLFSDAMMKYLFIKAVDELTVDEKSVINPVCDDKFASEIITKIERVFILDLGSFDEIRTKIVNHIIELQKIGQTTTARNKKDDDYLTKFQKLAETYSVSNKDLAHVPANMVEDVKKYVLEFRLHVLTDLEKKQEERALKDQLEAKRTSKHRDALVDHQIEKDISGSNKKLSDIEYETLLQNKEKVASDKNYYIRLSQYKPQEELRLRAYQNFLKFNKHESYVKNIIPQNRKKFMASFVDNVIDTNNRIDKNFSYYTKHANYVKFRAKIKESEESVDLEGHREVKADSPENKL